MAMYIKISVLRLAHNKGMVNIIFISQVRKQRGKEVKLLGSVNVQVRLKFQIAALWSQHAFKHPT